MSKAIEKVKAAPAVKNATEGPKVVQSLNDCLAVERTIMANERTLLAYVRTSLAVLVVAVTIIKFFSSQGMVILGYVLLIVGVVCATFGLMRFTDSYQKLKALTKCEKKFHLDDEID